MEKGDGEKKPPGRSRPASDRIVAASSSSSSYYASVNDDATQLEESIPASSIPQHIDNLNAQSQPLASRAYAIDSGVLGIPSHFHQTHHGRAVPPYFLSLPGAGAASAAGAPLSGPVGPPPHGSRRPSPPPAESLLLGRNLASNTLLYMSQGAASSTAILPLPSFAPGANQQERSNHTLTTTNAEKPAARDHVLLPRPQPLRSGPVPDSPAQGLHTKQTAGPNNGLINGYVPQALDSSAPLMVPPIGYQLPSRDDQKQGEIFIPHNNDVIVGGRGHETSVHPGNEKYRKLIDSVREAYWNSCKRDKPHVSAGIVRAVRAQNPPGRFLQRKDAKELWFDVGDIKAREKTSHALREGISKESKMSGGGKIFIGKLHHNHHHQAKKSKNNKVSRGEESSAGDIEQHEYAGQQMITGLTTNKKVATSNRRPSGSSVPGAASAAPGSSSDPTGRRSEQVQASSSSRGGTRNKRTASPSADTKASEGHHAASSAASSSTCKQKRGRPPGSKTKKRHRRFLIDGSASNPAPPTVLSERTASPSADTKASEGHHAASSAASSSTGKRKRGRPPGSKTKKRHRRFLVDGIASNPPPPTVLPPTKLFVLPPISIPPFLPPPIASADRRMVEVRHSSVASEERTHARNFSGNRTKPLKQFLPHPMAHAAHNPRPLPPPAVTPKPSDLSDLERRLSFADHLTNSSCSGNLSEHLQQQRDSTDRYLMAGLLGLDPSEMTQMLGSGKTEEEVIGEHLKDAGDDRKHTSSSTTEKQKSRVVNAERLYAEMWSSTDPKKPLERRIKKALFSIGFVKEKK